MAVGHNEDQQLLNNKHRTCCIKPRRKFFRRLMIEELGRSEELGGSRLFS